MIEADDDEWDAFIGSHPDGHHEQSSGFARSRAGWGFQCDRIVVRSDGCIVGGLLALARQSPIGNQALVLRGPLAAGDDPVVLDKVVDSLAQLAQQRSYASVRVETFPTQDASRSALERGGFLSSAAWEGVRPSILVPLAFSDKEILASMKPKGRYNVRLAERAGVIARRSDADSLDDFFTLHQATASHQGFPVFPREYFDYVWRVFAPNGRVQLFLAHHNGKPIAAILNAVVGRRLYYGWGGMDRDPERRKLMANYLLHFHAMGWARENGCTHYDLVGVTEFKEKLARDEIQWPLPQCRYFGPLRALRRSVTELTWSVPALRRGTEMIARRLQPTMPMPY